MSNAKSDRIAQQAQNFYSKGVAAYQRGNYDIAADMLMQCLSLTPGFINARQTLRATQIAKFKRERKGGLAAKLQEASMALTRMKIEGLLKAGKTNSALVECEKLLLVNPLHSSNVELAVRCAEAAEQPEAALFTIEGAYENNQDDMNLLSRVADYYMATGDYVKARDAYIKLTAGRPSDMTVVKKLKDAEARVTMDKGGWEDQAGKKDGYLSLIADKEQAAKLDMQSKAVVSGADAEALIEEQRAKIAAEPNNLNSYRALARLFVQNKRFQDAVDILQAARKINAADPELDRALTNAKIGLFEFELDHLRSEGEGDAAAAKEVEMNQFIFDDLSSRVERYPNDLRLRFELGQQYFKYEHFDDAISQFQLSQRSPRERIESLYYLAMCFVHKGQGDMAVMQLETANDQLPIMDALKMKVVFALGKIAEEAGDFEKAYGYYKDVYAADIGFEDIGERMERIYKLRQAHSS